MVSNDSAVYFVDDGSKDRTWAIIESMATRFQRVCGVKLSRNRGHQHALMAGLFSAEGDALVSIDADLQDDVSVIEEMVSKHLQGAEIVYGVRSDRSSDSWFKRASARSYYRILGLMGVEIMEDHADFRLMGRRAVQCLSEYSEINLFLRGLVPLIGFRSDTVRYERAQRYAGESKYPLRRMMALAIDGVTSFSVIPLRMISMLGFLICLMSLAMIVWVVYGKYVLGTVLPGWASSVLPVYFLGGIQLLSLGIMGEYVAKIYLETKRRPRYFIEKTV